MSGGELGGHVRICVTCSSPGVALMSQALKWCTDEAGAGIASTPRRKGQMAREDLAETSGLLVADTAQLTMGYVNFIDAGRL